MKRLTAIQKRHAVFTVLCGAKQLMTANSIGKEIGFQNGAPIIETLCEMQQLGELDFTKDQLNTGTEIYLWRVTLKGRNAAFKEFEIQFV